MEKRWLDPKPVKVPHAIREAVGGHPLVAETLVRRGFRTVPDALAFIDPDHYQPAPPDELPGMIAAIERITHALEAGERICVWGDFDVDGQTATTVLVSTLRDLGGDVIFHIPVRATESHGMKVPWLKKELDKGIKLIVTCDTGVDAHEAIAYAAQRGVDTVVTDHHELPSDLPPAMAVVNPHLLPDRHPLSALPGVGVAYKLAEALYASVGRPGAASRYLDLVALGIVADVATLVDDARYLLQLGLKALRVTSRLGLQELLKLAEVAPPRITEEDIGFSIAPRLNALGRLDDANVIVEFLTTEDLSRARILASQLEALNSRRKELCDQVYAEAVKQIEEDASLAGGPILVLEDPDWPHGVIGIVATRLVEQHHRPTILIATPSGEVARGSARSVDGCHITDLLATQAHLLESFGGHEMAAGLAIDPERIPELRKGLEKVMAPQVEFERAAPLLQTDGDAALGELSLSFVSDLQRLAPFGPGNPPLTLVVHDIAVKAQRQLGRSGKHLRVTVEDRERIERNVVWWNWQDAPLPTGRFDLAFTVRINAFRGDVDVQMIWEDARLTEEAAVAVAQTTRPLEVLDFRTHGSPETALDRLLHEEPDVVVWAEGPDAQKMVLEAGPTFRTFHRFNLRPAQTLVIWTPPPGLEVLRRVLERVDPTRVALFTGGGVLGPTQSFLRYLAGLAKYALRSSEGRVSVPELAAATGQRELDVRLGLAWLDAKGHLSIIDEGGLLLQLAPGVPRLVSDDAVRRISFDLQSSMEETEAYRQFYRQGSEDNILSVLPERERKLVR